MIFLGVALIHLSKNLKKVCCVRPVPFPLSVSCSLFLYKIRKHCLFFDSGRNNDELWQIFDMNVVCLMRILLLTFTTGTCY